MSLIALSKTLDPADYAELAEELIVVDQHFASASPQHPARRWEYALALRAFTEWGGQAIHRCVDVGGAGSPFWRMLPVDHVLVVDPLEGQDLATYLTTRPRLADAVFCLSVIEHLPSERLDQFLYHLSCLVAPGGLLVLTMDACGCASHTRTEPDRHHFHWMRQQIFTEMDRQELLTSFHRRACDVLDAEYDSHYYGDQVYDYSFASLVLRKRA